MMMQPRLDGLHHVTALTADGQKNIDFYCGVLGLRLAKVTVNFDDPRSYHLYFGDAIGSPGSGMTFFVWPGARAGRIGVRQVSATAFSVPGNSLDAWRTRLEQRGVHVEEAGERFGEQVLSGADPDGLRFELVANDNDAREPWLGSDVPAEHAIRGFHSVSLSEERVEQTAALLTGTLGFRAEGNEGNRFRFITDERIGGTVDVLSASAGQRGLYGAGAVHHVAFRTPDDEHQRAWREVLVGMGFNVSPIMDRFYFRSIYFREPGGVLFEIATEAPGFTADEPKDELGTSLKLPAMHEPMREQIEAALPKLRLPNGTELP